MIKSLRKRNPYIELQRFTFSILIIALHTDPFLEINPFLHFCFSQVLSRLGVPFFAAVTGFFYKPDKYRSVLKFLKLYLLWSIMYLAFDILFLHHNLTLTMVMDNVFYHSRAPLWYLYAMAGTLLLYNLCRTCTCLPTIIGTVTGIIGIMRGSVGALFQEIALLNIDVGIVFDCLFFVFPFFMLGRCAAQIIRNNTLKISTGILILTSIMFLFEVALTTLFHLKNNLTVCVTMFPLICALLIFDHYLYEKQGKVLRRRHQIMITLGGVSQYVFLIHFPLMYLFNWMPYTLKFCCTAISSITISFLFLEVKNIRLKR